MFMTFSTPNCRLHFYLSYPQQYSMCIQFGIEEVTLIGSEDFSPHYLNEQVSLGLRPLKRQTNSYGVKQHKS